MTIRSFLGVVARTANCPTCHRKGKLAGTVTYFYESRSYFLAAHKRLTGMA